MTSRKTLRITTAVACASAFALLSAPAAMADSATATHTDSQSIYSRTVSNTTPAPGEIITYAQTFTTTSGNDYIYDWKNNVDSCLEYQSGSATLQIGNASAITLPEDKVTATPGATAIKSNDASGYWTFNKDAPHTFTLQYKVSDACAQGKELTSGFYYKYGSFLSSKTYGGDKFNGGPGITVVDASRVRTSVELVDTPDTAVVDRPLTLKAKVTASANDGVDAPSLAGKKVSFVSGSHTLCTADIAAITGTATCDWTPTNTGNFEVKAVLEDSAEILGSSSAAKSITVTVAPPEAPSELKAEPANAFGKAQTVISGKAEPGTIIEALGPGGTRCVAKTDDEGAFSCNLGFLPAVPGTVSVTAARGDAKSEPRQILVNTQLSFFDSLSSPGLPKFEFPVSGN